MAKVDYGAVALIPVGDYSASRQYHANELVGYQGSSYIALQNPPVGTLPTNTTYFMLHTEGTSIATASTPGTVKPDGTSTVVDANGAMSVKPSILQTIQDTSESAEELASKIGNVPTGKTLQSQIDDLEPRVSSSEQALTVNLLNPTSPSGTLSGITVVRNADNSYTISGTNTSESTSTIALALIASIGFENGKTYRVLGCPSNTPAGVYIRVGAQIKENGEGANFTYPVQSGQQIFISIVAGTVIETPITIKPMITTNLSATYDDYVPYSGSSGKLDTDYKALSEKIGNVGNTDLQSQVNAATQSIAQNTTDIAANAAGISALNTGLTYRFIGSQIGTTPIALPTAFNKVYVEVSYNNNNTVTFNIPKVALTNSDKLYISGWGFNNYNNYCYIMINSSSVHLGYYESNSEIHTNETYISVYVR